MKPGIDSAQGVTLCTGCGWDGRDKVPDTALSCCPERDMRPLPAFFAYAETQSLPVRGLMLGWALKAKMRATPEAQA